MTELDLRSISRLCIKILSDDPWNFSIEGDSTSPVLVGGSSTFTIKKINEIVQTLTLGNGLTATGRSIAVNPNILSKGKYIFDWVIIAVTGEIFYIKGTIESC